MAKQCFRVEDGRQCQRVYEHDGDHAFAGVVEDKTYALLELVTAALATEKMRVAELEAQVLSYRTTLRLISHEVSLVKEGLQRAGIMVNDPPQSGVSSATTRSTFNLCAWCKHTAHVEVCGKAIYMFVGSTEHANCDCRRTDWVTRVNSDHEEKYLPTRYQAKKLDCHFLSTLQDVRPKLPSSLGAMQLR